jgi:hypothetical protein
LAINVEHKDMSWELPHHTFHCPLFTLKRYSRGWQKCFKRPKSLESYSKPAQEGIEIGWRVIVLAWGGNLIEQYFRAGKTRPDIHWIETDFRDNPRRVWIRGR